jgi:CHAT domain-containing protein
VDLDTRTLLLRGSEASETRFKQEAPGRRVLHLATHGFFLGDTCASPSRTGRGIGGLVGDKTSTSRPVGGENPLLLSGLVLAGANRRESVDQTQEDGILTAEEVAAMDLSGVQWAVLSACDTGIGQLMPGEGVSGLRRAFQVAGASTVIMSLWKVEDASAREWMQALYEARLLEGLDTAEAVRKASVSFLTHRRDEGYSTHPFFWAAFVAAGDWR